VIVQVVQVGSIGVQVAQGVGSVDVAVTFGPLGGVPVAVATLSTCPTLMSDWVSAYVALAVPTAPGDNVLGVTTILDKPNFESDIETEFKLILPVLVTLKV
jgi:hypothetical protein